jgi:predicted MFS family arabinose efflux permease
MNRKWQLVGGGWLLAAVLNAYIIVPASFFSVISEQLAISSTAASWFVSVMFGVGVLASVPAGIALDRVDNRRAIVVAAGTLFVSCLWSWHAARTGSYWSLLAARALGGLTFPVIWTGCMNLIGRAFDAATHATAIGVFTTSAPAGFAIGQLSGSLLASLWDWTIPFGVFAVPAALAGGIFWMASPHVPARSAESSPPQLSDFRYVLTNRHVQSVAVMGFLAYSVYVFFNSWMPTYLTDQLGLSLAASGVLVAAFPAMGVLSRSGSGFISDWFLTQRRQPLVTVAFGAALPLVAVIAVSKVVAVLVLCLVLAGLFVQLGIGILYTYVQELVDPTVGATALAALTMMSSLGSFTAPIVTGFLIERTEGYVAAFGYALLIVGIGTVLAYRGPEPNAS